jgi:hypothetical protein
MVLRAGITYLSWVFLIALRGAAVLNARVLKDTESVRAVHNPSDSGDDNNSLINSVRDSPSNDSVADCGNLEFLNRGCEFLKRTRKGEKMPDSAPTP